MDMKKRILRSSRRSVDGVLRELGVVAPSSKDEAALWILASVKKSASEPNLTALNLVGKLVTALPELERPYMDEIKSYYGLPGNYWVVSVVWRPSLKARIAAGKDGSEFVDRSTAFMEQVCNSGDREAINVLWIEIFEWLVHSTPGELKLLWPVLGPSTKEVIREVARRRNELQNLP